MAPIWATFRKTMATLYFNIWSPAPNPKDRKPMKI